MTEETPNLNFEQKKANYKHINENLNKYMVDSQGNFYSLELDTSNDSRYYIARNALFSDDYKKLREKIDSQQQRQEIGWEAPLPPLLWFPSLILFSYLIIWLVIKFVSNTIKLLLN